MHAKKITCRQAAALLSEAANGPHRRVVLFSPKGPYDIRGLTLEQLAEDATELLQKPVKPNEFI